MSNRTGAPPRALVHALVAMMCLVWGSTWMVIREGLHDLPPFTGASARLVLGGTLMALLVPLLARREGGTQPPAWLWVAFGTTNFASSYGILYVSERVLPSGLASVLWAVFPLVMAAAGHWFLSESIRLAQLLGMVLGLVGTCLLFATDVRSLGPEGVPMALLLLCSPLVSAVGTTLVKRFGSGCSSLYLNRNAMLLAAAELALVAWWQEADAPMRWTLRTWLCLGYLGAVGTTLCFGTYMWLLRWAPASELSIIALVTPCLALVLSWSVGESSPTPGSVGGAALVVGGVAMALLLGRPKGRAT